VSGDYAGGLVGYNYYSNIRNSYAVGNITGDSYNGGLVGHHFDSSNINNSYAAGNVNGDWYVGGLVGGSFDSNIDNSFASGSITGSLDVGGLVGNMIGTINIENVRWYNDTTDDANVCIGNNESHDCNSGAETYDKYFYDLGNEPMASWDLYPPWDFFCDFNGYPHLAWQGVDHLSECLFKTYPHPLLIWNGTGVYGDPYEITNCNQLQNMSLHLFAYYELNGTVDCSATSGWNSGSGFDPIGDNGNKFTGGFNGRGYTIIDLFINRSAEDYVGLFGYTGYTGSAEIMNVRLIGVNISGKNFVGGLVGRNFESTVDGSSVIGSVTGVDDVGGLVGQNYYYSAISDSHATGNVNGTDNIGGLIGRNYESTINGSSSGGDVVGINDVGGLVGHNEFNSEIDNSRASGSVNASGNEVGGLVGWNNYSHIDASYAIGDVVGVDSVGGLVGESNHFSTVYNSYATGSVNASGNMAGGLIGFNNHSEVERSYAVGNVSGVNSTGGLVGENDDASVGSSFSVGSVSASGINYGGLVGNDNDGDLIGDSYWYDHVGDNASDCVGSDVADVCGTESVDIENANSDPTYFFDMSNPPFHTWGSSWDSICDGSGFPALEWQGLVSAASCSTYGYVAPSVVTPPVVGGGSSGGGGGGYINLSRITHVPTVEEVEEGYEKEISHMQKIKFEIDGEEHLITVTHITEDNVTLLVQSDDKIITLSIGETRKIDLNGDGFYDLQIFLESITFYEAYDGHHKANIIMTEIDEEASSELFDIRMDLESALLSRASELEVVITFFSFGTIPTSVDLAYVILDEDELEVYSEADEITVITQEVLRKTFEGLELPNGKYTFILGTLYGDDVFDKFEQEFEIGKRRGITGRAVDWIGGKGRWWLIGIVIASLIVGLIYFRRKRKTRRKTR
jgi:hypothetical protein